MFNVRGLSSATKRNQLSEDLGRLHIDICCLQETKCPGGFDEHPGNYRLIGLQSKSRHYSLAFAVDSHMEDRIVRYWSESDRIALIQLRLARNSLYILTIINVYRPTSQRVNNNNAEQDEFFSDLAHLTSQYMSCALFYIYMPTVSQTTLGRLVTREHTLAHCWTVTTDCSQQRSTSRNCITCGAASRRCAHQSVFGIIPACWLTNPTEQSSATPSRRSYQKSTRMLQPTKDGVRWKIS